MPRRIQFEILETLWITKNKLDIPERKVFFELISIKVTRDFLRGLGGFLAFFCTADVHDMCVSLKAFKVFLLECAQKHINGMVV